MRGYAFLAFLLLALPALAASGPPREPILQVEAGMHLAAIRNLDVDTRARFVVTASADKTLRLWELPSLRLRRTFRVPVGAGPEGRLNAVAVSPDGLTVAAAGWTGWEWEKSASVYFFETSTGRMWARLSGLPQAVRNLAFSPDGRHLAVGLTGDEGIRIFRTDDFSLAAQDGDYGGRNLDLDFDARGRLVTSSLDGWLRLYDERFAIVAKVRAPGGGQPLDVRFSPDGSRIAVGYMDGARVDVLSGEDLSLLYAVPTDALSEQTNLYAVSWSRDGSLLYAGGEFSGAGRNAIHRWKKRGRVWDRSVPVVDQRVGTLRPIDEGLVFTAEDPALGILDEDGRPRVVHGPPVADFRDLAEGFRVSKDGATIEFAYESRGARPARFALGEREISPARGDLSPPRRAAEGLRLSYAEGETPTLNDRPLALEDHERVRHHAVSHDGKTVVVATEWAVRCFEPSGALRWSVLFPDVVWAVNVSGDDRYALAALADGTIRWYRMENGEEVLAFFPHPNGRDWIAWLPSGHYDSSPHGDTHVGWLLNRGMDRPPDFFPAVQFERIFYRPDHVRGALDGTKPGEAATEFESFLPPEVEIAIDRVMRPTVSGPRWELEFSAKRRSLDMLRFTVFVNRIPVTAFEDRDLSGEERRAFSRRVGVALPRRLNEIRVEVDTRASRGVATTHVTNSGRLHETGGGSLYVLAIGASELERIPAMSLRYAARDAANVDLFFRGREGGAFRSSHVRLVADGSTELPTRSGILAALDFLRGARADDTVVLFLAGHGISDAAGNYYFVPRDALPGDVNRAQVGEGVAGSLVRWDELLEGLRGAVGRRVLVVDTCFAQQITGRLDMNKLAKHSASSQFALLAASRADEPSLELVELRGGVYTSGILRALAGAGDSDADGAISLSEVHGFAAEFVGRYGSDQAPQFVAPRELEDTVLSGKPRTGRR